MNQPPPLAGYNMFVTDRVLREAVVREGAGWAWAELEEYGRKAGSAEAIEWGVLANEYPPVLQTHDRYGRRRDEVEFHPAWHHLMRLAVEHGIHSGPWARPRPGAHVARAALAMLASENEAGHICPISMTYASVPVLRKNEGIADQWNPLIVSTSYDPAFRPAPEKHGALVGMAMTEKQGGSDVRANVTRAEPACDGAYLLNGHKWFCSAPMSDAFLVLAQAPRGLSCFLLPRWTPDGKRNAFHLQRLKPKLGNRSNASSEVELRVVRGRRNERPGAPRSCHERFFPALPRSAGRNSISAADVTSRRGTMRCTSTPSQFVNPEMTECSPAASARKPSRATRSAGSRPTKRSSGTPAALGNSETVGPGHNAQTRTPWPSTSRARASAEPLACGIGGHVGHALVGGRGRYDQDGARTAFHHAGQVKVSEMNQSRAVQLDDPEFAFAVTRAERAVGADARIIDQQVDGDAPLSSEGKNRRRRIGLGKIGGQHLDADAMRRMQSSAESCKPPGTSRRQNKVRAARGQFLRQCRADPGTSPGDQCPLSTPGAVRHDG